MSARLQGALTPEQWSAHDYRQPAGELDRWAAEKPERSGDDSTEYVAKLGLSDHDCVIAMNRAHDRVLVPPPARHALAAFALSGQPFGFTREDVALVRAAAEGAKPAPSREALNGLAERLEALLPPGAAERGTG
jgi:hypothetical protein